MYYISRENPFFFFYLTNGKQTLSIIDIKDADSEMFKKLFMKYY